MNGTPLVTCIMPTKDRHDWVKQSIKLFQEQTYPNRQLLIVDDSETSLGLDDDYVYGQQERIERCEQIAAGKLKAVDYYWVGGTQKHLHAINPDFRAWTLGAKRNAMVEASQGDIICHWDDDDYYAPTRIDVQVELMRLHNAPVCGNPHPLFYDLRTGKSYRYFCRERPYLYSSSLMYTREFWAAHPFPDLQVASATEFEWCTPERLDSRAECWNELVVGIAHPSNTSPKLWEPSCYTASDTRFLAFLGTHTAWYEAMARRFGGLPPETTGDANDCSEVMA